MKPFLKLIIGLFFVLTLTGCFGESYDFSPPTVSLLNANDSQLEELEEANIDWHSDKDYKKETVDILSFAREQIPFYFSSGEQVFLNLENGDFDLSRISISVWQNDKKIDLEFKKDNQSLYLPKEKGEYVIVVDLHTDLGSAQYVGDFIIK